MIYPATIEIQGQENTLSTAQTENSNHCINVESVYDWVKDVEGIHRYLSVPLDCNQAILNCLNEGQMSRITCERIADSLNYTIIEKPKPVPEIEGASKVKVKFAFQIEIRYYCDNQFICTFETPVTFIKDMVLYFPPGAAIRANIQSIECTATGVF